jgi:hypothetical protein
VPTEPTVPTVPTVPVEPTVPTVPVVRYDIAVTGTNAPTPIVGGGTTAYVLTATNAGPDTATDVAIAVTADALQTLGAIQCVAAGGGTCPANPAASMRVPSLPSGASLTFTVSSQVATAARGTLGSTMTVTAAGDITATNNSARSTAQVVEPNSITLQSEPGDFIGGGGSYHYTRANAGMDFSITGRQVGLQVEGDETWYAYFELPSSVSGLQPGTYANLTLLPRFGTASGGLNWTGEGRSCTTLAGTITVNPVTYAGEVDITFEQYCNGTATPLRGRIHWTPFDNTAAPGPQDPPPAGLWKPTNVTLPAGNHVYLVSDPGDSIGAGGTHLYTPADTTVTLRSSGNQLQIDVGGWTGNFVAMNSVPQLRPGYYGDTQRYPFHNPAKGGLSWDGFNRGCSVVSGWFVVDDVVYTGTTLTSIDLRFEQHCQGDTPALRGRIRWSP